MPSRSRALFARSLLAVIALVVIWAASASIGAAQFGLPKVPKLPKKTTPTAETKPSKSDSPEVAQVLSVAPDAAPPGGHGEVVLTGQNFSDGMQVQFA